MLLNGVVELCRRQLRAEVGLGNRWDGTYRVSGVNGFAQLRFGREGTVAKGFGARNVTSSSPTLIFPPVEQISFSILTTKSGKGFLPGDEGSNHVKKVKRG